ncbi:MAG TPA: cytochrome c [Anaerolineae bacterium]|nr:cytochrome c [Anaerolineae bacterium]
MPSISDPRFSFHTVGAKLLALLLATLLVVGMAQLARADPLAQAGEGETLFKEKCAACHSVGEGDKVGPDLQGVTARRDRDWLLRWIAAPDQVLASGDPIATQLFEEYKQIAMPNLGLTPAQAESLVAYFDAIDAGTIAPPAAQVTAPLAQGNAALGRELFTGAARFQNGGPPCMGCHSIGGIGALGGGVLGPDLTPAFSKFGDAGLASLLSTIPLPTMNPIFGLQGLSPLTPEEQANLRAFLQQASLAERPPDALVQLLILSAIGAALTLVLAHIFWRKRLVAVRRPLVTPARLASGPMNKT